MTKATSKGENDPGHGDSQGSKTGMGIDVTKAHALLIGVGRCQYDEWSLEVSTRDVNELRKTLADSELCGYPERQIQMLSDEAATRDGILAAVDRLAKTAAADSDGTFLVYYSGHGWLDTSQGGERYYLIPHDVRPQELTASALPAKDFIQGLRSLRGKRVLVMIDTCHAAGMADAKDPAAVVKPKGFAAEPFPKALVEELGMGEGRAVFLSCSEAQKSWILAGDGSLSIFTHHLLEALAGAGGTPGDRVVTISSLMGHLSEAVPESARVLGREQTPVFRFDTRNFAVALKRGGKDLPTAADQRPAAAGKTAPSAPAVHVVNARAGENLVIAGKIRDLTLGGQKRGRSKRSRARR